jgi:hypothetical protein
MQIAIASFSTRNLICTIAQNTLYILPNGLHAFENCCQPLELNSIVSIVKKPEIVFGTVTTY